MTLNEAIKHCEEKAEEHKKTASRFAYPDKAGTTKESADCLECAKEHEQLAEWLKQLQKVKKIVDDWHTIMNIQDANDAMADYFNQILEVLKGNIEK